MGPGRGPHWAGPKLAIFTILSLRLLFVFSFFSSFVSDLEKEGEGEMKEATTSGGASAGANDPRQPTTARPYAPPKLSSQDLPVDYAGFLAVVFGVVGVMMHVRNNHHHASCSRCLQPPYLHNLPATI